MGCNNSKQKKRQNGDVKAPQANRLLLERKRSAVLSIAYVRDIPSDTLARKIGEHPARLSVIKLDGVMLSDMGAAELARCLVHGRHGKTLRSLRVASCNVGSEGATSLAGVFLATKIMCLDLSGNAIRSDGVKALVAAVRGRKKWGAVGSRVELRLSENPLVGTPPHVGVAALAELATAIEKVPRRKALELRGVGLRFNARTSTHGGRLMRSLAQGRFEVVDLRANELDDEVAALLSKELQEAAGPIEEVLFSKQPSVELEELHAAACRLDDGAAANSPAFSSVDGPETDDSEMPLFGRVTPAALAKSLVAQGAAAWCNEKFIVGLGSQYDDSLPLLVEEEDKTMVDLEAWRNLMSRLSMYLSPSTQASLIRLDLRLNPMSAAAAASLSEVWLEIISRDSNETQMLLLYPTVTPAPQTRQRAIRISKSMTNGSDQHSYFSSRGSAAAASDAGDSNTSKAAVVKEPPLNNTAPSSERQAHCRWVLSLTSAGVDVTAKLLSPLQLDQEIAFSVDPCEPNPRRTDVPRVLVTATAHSGDFAWAWLDEQFSELAAQSGDVTFIDQLTPDQPSPGLVTSAAAAAAPPPALLPGASDRFVKLLAIFEDGGNDVRGAFKQFDATGDGEISVAELHNGLTSLPGFDSISREDVETIIAEASVGDGDAHVSLEELVDFLKQGRVRLGLGTPPVEVEERPIKNTNSEKLAKLLLLYEDSGNDLKGAFDKFDASSDGELSIAELHTGLLNLGAAFKDLTKDEVAEVVKTAFGKEDSHVTFDDFAAFVDRARKQAAAS